MMHGQKYVESLH